MGAVPEAHDQIISLDGVVYDEVDYGGNSGYRFKPAAGLKIKELTRSEIEALDTIIAEVGGLNAPQIVERMHNEEAYKSTPGMAIV